MKSRRSKFIREFVLAAIFVSTISCSSGGKSDHMFDIFKAKDPIEAFWKWFAENKSKFEKNPDVEPAPDLNPILTQLRSISDGLSVEVSREINGVRDLVISANGARAKFPIVQRIVEKAPAIEGWTITPFRQRANIAFVLESPSIRLATNEMKFEPLLDNGEIDVIVYAKDVAGLDKDVLNHFGMVVIDNVLGEYDSVMKVRQVDFQDQSKVRDEEQLKPLLELPKFVDDFYNRTNN